MSIFSTFGQVFYQRPNKMNKTYRYLSLPVLFLLFRVLAFPSASTENVSGNGDDLQPTWSGACADTINITLNDQCQFELTPSLLLVGDFSSCSASSVRILVDDFDPSNGGIVDGCGVFRFFVEALSPGSCGAFTSCWGYILAEDKTAPIITLPEDDTLTLGCEQVDLIKNVASSVSITGDAVVSDYCSATDDLNISFKDQVIYSDDCDTITIKRTFSATDEKGNNSSATQNILLAAPQVADVDIQDTFLLDTECTFLASVNRDENGQIHPSVSGYPFYVNSLGDTIDLSGSHCALSSIYSDQVFTTCETAEKLIRTWTISDWCADEKITLVQFIKFGDVDPPVVTCRQDTQALSTDPFNCTGSFLLDMPEVTDVCGNYEISASFYVIELKGAHGFPIDPDTILHQSWDFTSDGQFLVTDVPIGCHFVRYTVRDACGNTTSLDCIVCVADEIAPTASCDDRINLTLDDTGYGQIIALEMDEGTSDNCGMERIQIRRIFSNDPEICEEISEPFYSEWGEKVAFSCCDAGLEVTVELLATDIYGNQSTCWGTVLVEDKFRPTCSSPQDVTTDCNALPVRADLMNTAILNDLFGHPVVMGNCSADIIEREPTITLDNCGVGSITRHFVALDGAGEESDECSQIISVEAHNDYWIKFPKDYEEFCAEPTPDSLLFSEAACDLMAVSIQDEILETRSEECYKIFRTYRVINWCEYDGEAQPVIVGRDWDGYNGDNPQNPEGDDAPGNDDIYVHVKRNFADGLPDTVYYDNNTNPYDESVTLGSSTFGYWWRVISGGNDPSEEDYYEGNGSVWSDDGNQTDSDISGNAQSDDNDYRYGSFGFWQYTQHIKVTDVIPPEIFYDDNLVYCLTNDDCSADVDISFAVTDNCTSGGVDIDIDVIDGPDEFFEFEENPFTVVGRYPKYILNGKIPEGEYRIEIDANDRCGNVTKIIFEMDIVDCKAPSPICINGLATELMPVEDGEDVDGDGDADLGAMTVWASDFLASDISEDCSGPVVYSINRKGETPDINQDFLTVTCDDPEYLEIEIHAWDSADNPFNIDEEGNTGGPNHDYCNTYILVQDNMFSLCDPTDDDEDNFTIEGAVQTEYEQPIPDVNLSSNFGSRSNWTTDDNGRYTIDGLEPGGDYSITPEKSDNVTKGVSTFDIVQIGKHILNTKPLGTAYKKIAADVNGSGTITTLDLIQLRKVVLNIEDQFPIGKSWRFIPSHFQFQTDQQQAEDFPETLNLNNLAENYLEAHFIGVKMGDVNDNALTRSSRQLSLQISAESIKSGIQTTLPVYLNGVNQDLEGLQFALMANHAQFDLVDVTPGLITEAHLFLDPSSNQLLVSWDKFSADNQLRNDQPIFWVTIDPISDVDIAAQGFTLNNRQLKAEGYSSSEEWMQVNLAFATSASAHTTIGSFMPNPFIDRTSLQFRLDQDQEITWSITDAMGRQIRQWNENRASGQQEIIIHDNDLTGPGIYYLTLYTKQGKYTSRLVHLW